MSGCDFKPGDRVVRVRYREGAPFTSAWACDPAALLLGAEATVREVTQPIPGHFGIFFEEFWTEAPGGFAACCFRKVQRKNPRLSIEAFMTMPGGFEEPKRKAPVKPLVPAEQAGRASLNAPPDDSL